MSRIGKQPIAIPDGVSVNVANGEIQVKGPKGNLSCVVPEGIGAKVEDGQIVFERPKNTKDLRALQGLARSLANNMVVGVSTGFTKLLEIEGVGYRAEVKEKVLKLLLGFSHPVTVQIPEGLKVAVEQNTRLSIEGADKQSVGQFAADVRALRPPEPYKGKGVRYADEHIRRKVGKAGA